MKEAWKSAIRKFQQSEATIICVIYGHPYILQYIPENVNVLIMYEKGDIAETIAAQILLGELEASGSLPVSASSFYRYGKGIKTTKIGLCQSQQLRQFPSRRNFNSL